LFKPEAVQLAIYAGKRVDAIIVNISNENNKIDNKEYTIK